MRQIRMERRMTSDFRAVPVEGVTELPDLRSLVRERPGRRSELLLLNVMTANTVLVVVFCAWILFALD
jgi:hypothetical protein